MAKVKGLLRGLRYISQIFDEQKKEPEMKIGLPTDVKHLAHIGWDGPSAETPSWMEGFKKPEEGHQSVPLSVAEAKKKHDDKWVSEDSLKRRDQPGVPKSSRRLSGKKKSLSSSSGTSSPKEEKSRHSRRHHLKDSESSRLNRVGSAEPDESPTRSLQEIPKKSRARRKKSSKSRRDSSDSGSGFVTCGSDPESPTKSSNSTKKTKSSNSTKKDKESSEAC